MMFKVISIVTTIYLILVFRVYSLTLYYTEFDNVRKYAWLAPFITVILFIYAISEKESSITNCFIFHLPTTYALIGIGYCLLKKEHQPKKKAVHSKQYKRDQEMKVLLKNTERILCGC